MVEQIAGDRMGERESVALATKSDGLFLQHWRSFLQATGVVTCFCVNNDFK